MLSDRLKSISFKKKYLENKNVNILNKSDEEILSIYSKFTSDVKKSKEYKIRFILKNHKKYSDDFCETKESLELMNIENINSIFAEFNSVKSSIAMKNNINMGNSFVVSVEDLKFNINGLNNIKVRSSMEKDIVQFFEKFKIYWQYEPVSINYFYIFKRKYIVDFKFLLDSKEYFLEVKGSVRESDFDKTSLKIKSGFDYFKNYIIYQKELITCPNDLINLKINSKDGFCLKHVYKEK